MGLDFVPDKLQKFAGEQACLQNDHATFQAKNNKDGASKPTKSFIEWVTYSWTSTHKSFI